MVDDNEGGHAVRANTAQTLARGLRVLSCFRRQSEMSVAELAAATELGRQVTQRLVNTLVDEGFLIQDERSSRYRLGLELIHLSHQALGAIRLRTVALPYMADVARISGLTVNLNVLDEHNMTALCVESIDGADKTRYNMHSGSVGALHIGASRKVILAHLPQPEIDMVLARLGLTEPARAALLAELSTIREQGWSITRGESQARAIGCAVPLFDANGRPAGSLTALGQVSQVDDDQIMTVIDHLMIAARQVNQQTGGRATVRPRRPLREDA